jgi:RNA polymerase sigma-70 factor (ECF subfamily)
VNDEDLLRRLRQGDEAALDSLIDHYSGYVAAVIRHTMRWSMPNEDVEELVSDVFFTLWEKAVILKPGSRLKPWLAVVARNKALNLVRARRSEPKLTSMADNATLEDGLPATQLAEANVNVLETIARNQLVLEALNRLDDESRNLMVSHYLDDRSIRDIALTTGFSESAVKSRLFRSRAVIRKYLQQEGIA